MSRVNDQAKQFLVRTADGQSLGPMDNAEVLRLTKRGQVRATDQISIEGSGAWVSVDSMPGLFDAPLNDLKTPPALALASNHVSDLSATGSHHSNSAISTDRLLNNAQGRLFRYLLAVGVLLTLIVVTWTINWHVGYQRNTQTRININQDLRLAIDAVETLPPTTTDAIAISKIEAVLADVAKAGSAIDKWNADRAMLLEYDLCGRRLRVLELRATEAREADGITSIRKSVASIQRDLDALKPRIEALPQDRANALAQSVSRLRDMLRDALATADDRERRNKKSEQQLREQEHEREKQRAVIEARAMALRTDPEGTFRALAVCFAEQASNRNDKFHALTVNDAEVTRTNSVISPIKGTIIGEYWDSLFGGYRVSFTFDWIGDGKWSFSEVSARWNGSKGLGNPDNSVALTGAKVYGLSFDASKCD